MDGEVRIDDRRGSGAGTDDPVIDPSLFLQGTRAPRYGGDHLDGAHRHPERFARRGAGQVIQAREALGEDLLPVVRPHDLRHTSRHPAAGTRRAGEGRPGASGSRERHHGAHRPPAREPGKGRQAADRSAALLEG